jgi:hypothetical protein
MIYLHLEEILKGTSPAKIAVPDIWLNQFDLNVMANSYAELLLKKAPL